MLGDIVIDARLKPTLLSGEFFQSSLCGFRFLFLKMFSSFPRPESDGISFMKGADPVVARLLRPFPEGGTGGFVRPAGIGHPGDGSDDHRGRHRGGDPIFEFLKCRSERRRRISPRRKGRGLLRQSG
jgi:hypothetical protein